MHFANYTSENICRALGLGGFANDWQLAGADKCIRVLLKPSFRREVCISLLCKAEKVSVSVVAALSQIWLQDWPVPHLTQVEQEEGILPEAQFARLSSLLELAAEPSQAPRVVVIMDGMQADTVLRADREGKLNLHQNVGSDVRYDSFEAEVIKLSHGAIGSPSVRNALADAGNYAGLRIPLDNLPPSKDVVRTMVFWWPRGGSSVARSASQRARSLIPSFGRLAGTFVAPDGPRRISLLIGAGPGWQLTVAVVVAADCAWQSRCQHSRRR